MTAYDPLTLAGLIAERAASSPDLDVLTIEGAGVRDDEVRTYAQLWTRARALAAGLLRLGVGPGARIGLLMANHVEFVDTMVACSLAGAVFVPIDPRTRGDKLAYMLRAASCCGVIAADYALPGLGQVRGQLPALHWVVGLPTDEGKATNAMLQSAGVRPYGEVAGTDFNGAVFPGSRADDPMQLIYTSGTTGDPKGIVMTHRRYCETSLIGCRLFGYRPDDRPYSGLSLTHANAQAITLGTSLANGLRCVLSRRFTKSRLWDITRRYGCTTFTLLGGMTTALYAEPARPDDADNPVRFVLSAGMPAAIWRSFEARFGVQVMEFYGAAEGGMTVNPIGVGPVGSIGKPIPTLQYRIVDEQGRDCPRGTPGEILFRAADGTPYHVEYYGDPAASARKCADGWLHMGDVVVEDANGWLYFQYRKGSGIRRNGDFISTAFIEKTIAELPEVNDVYVYGVAAANGAPGEKDVVAAIVPQDPATFQPQALFRECRHRLEANVVPTYIQVLAQIPKTASEKPQDRFLIEALERDPGSVHREAR
ncbi:MAG TPA: AMP-binding protein [Steroidobacteraceae bacterium]